MRSESQDGNRRSVDLSRSDAEIFGEVASNIRRARIVHLVSVLESACLRELMCKRVSRSGLNFAGRRVEDGHGRRARNDPARRKACDEGDGE